MTQNALTPPRSQQERIDWIRLIRSRRVGPATFRKLMTEYRTAAAALDALPKVALAAGVKGYSACDPVIAQNEWQTSVAAGYHPIFMGQPTYPDLLAQTHDAPPLLWALGNLELLARPSISLVGARNASSNGIRMARQIARELGEAGFVVTSGFARGIDSAVHQAALHQGTIAVHAGGVDVIYPKENAMLGAEMAQHALRLSEHPLGLAPQARHFPQRNRIIAGLSQAVVVIEGAARSGSLITARAALDLGRDVMAVPGSPLDGRAAGCNNLIRDGAMLIRSGKDIIDALPPATLPHVAPTEPPPDQVENIPLDLSRKILSLLSPTPVAEDQVVQDLDLPPQIISAELTQLELTGKVKRGHGGTLALLV